MASVRPPKIAQRLVDAYVTGLRQRLPTICIRRLDHLAGATEEQLLRLRRNYPAAPAELVYLLSRVNGTYWEAIRAPERVGSTGAGSPAPAGRPSVTHASASAAGPAAATAPSPSQGLSASNAGTAAAPAAAAATGAAAPPPRPSATTAAASFLKSTLSGPDRRPVNKEKIAVPILGSLLGTCPYFLKTVEDMLHPLNQPFPPKRKSAPRPPAEGDVFAAEAQGAPLAGAGPTAVAAAAEPGGAREPAAISIATLYRSHRIVREPPPDPVPAPTDVDARKTVYVDPRIDTEASFGRWLAFADSMLPHHQPWVLHGDAEGAAADPAPAPAQATTARPPRKASVSRLYLDFAPDPISGGVSGQVVQYSRGEPESFVVIAPDFGSYLKLIMSEEYAFTEELEDEDEQGDEEDGHVEHRTGAGAEGAAKRAPAEGAHILSPSGQPLTAEGSDRRKL